MKKFFEDTEHVTYIVFEIVVVLALALLAALNSALHMAAAYGHYDAAYLLIAKGADINASDRYGQTPLDMAMGFDRHEVESLLRSRGGVCGNR